MRESGGGAAGGSSGSRFRTRSAPSDDDNDDEKEEEAAASALLNVCVCERRGFCVEKHNSGLGPAAGERSIPMSTRRVGRKQGPFVGNRNTGHIRVRKGDGSLGCCVHPCCYWHRRTRKKRKMK